MANSSGVRRGGDARLLTIMVLAAALGLGACSGTEGPSDETKFLELEVVRKLLAWAERKPVPGSYFDFGRIAAARRYDTLCLVRQYGVFHSLPISKQIDKYHSNFASTVPENHAALVAISGRQAHAALIRTGDLSLNIRTDCLTARASRLLRIQDPKYDRNLFVWGEMP